jgi:hypothetical protein
MPNTDLTVNPTIDLDTPAIATPDLRATIPTELRAVVDDLLGGSLAGIFERMEWAEEEIEQARARHPQHADRIYHAFLLLRPNEALHRMQTEFVYRSHCRELLDRV